MSAAAVCGLLKPGSTVTCVLPRGHHGDHQNLLTHPWPRTSRVGRGTSNGNQRGSAETRRRRRAWLLKTWQADVWGFVQRDQYGTVLAVLETTMPPGEQATAPGWTVEVACRCYRCGLLLVEGTVTVDRIVPGVKGGTYRRDNIRPACGRHNSETGARLASRKKGRKK